MLKDYKFIKDAGREINAAAEDAVRELFADYSNLIGREEELTARLRGELNDRLLKAVEKRLNGRRIRGCKFRVATFTKRQEKVVGADLMGVLQLQFRGRRISKAYLAQAKVDTSHSECWIGRPGETIAKASSPNMLNQVDSMLAVSSDSFVFVYHPAGIACVPALQVKLAGSNTISTVHHPYRSIGQFYEDFFKCFIGDHHIAPHVLGGDDLEKIAKETSARSYLLTHLNLENDATE
ncbi:MAG: hypothetical protein ACT4P9_13045 [Betaproteobacteria bacterium]